MMNQSDSENKRATVNAPLLYPHLTHGDAFDEVYDENFHTKKHWLPVLSHLSQLQNGRVQELHQRAQRILRDDGATYDLKNDPLSPDVWSLDIIPNVLDVEQWRLAEKGLAQRSEMFNLILKDIYGEQRLIKEGIVPAEIIFNHPDFIRQCHGLELPGLKSLILHACDMVRDVNGQFIVIGDQTQAPVGAGYALENRTVISRVLPAVFRQSHVRRLSGFFHTLRDTLNQLAAHKTDDPKIVLLTVGSSSSTYYEHAYLANYLGYPLVQAADLTVRNGKVWLKSLNGLTPVDVILRRTDDRDCDQVELNANSISGVPGLLEVVRNGNVVLANPLGSAVLESPALMAYLPRISQFFLNEDLILENVETRWCGDAQALDYVANNLDTLIVKPAYGRSQGRSIYGHCLTPEQKQDTLKKLRANPSEYVAQSYVPGSMVPVWSNARLEARPSLLKAFVVADGDGYAVMPGGLSRVAESKQDYMVTRLSGSLSKDFWVTADKPDLTHVSLLDKEALHDVQDINIPSRVVDNFFWFGRYAERAEMSIRLLRVVFKQLNGLELLAPESREVLLKAVSFQTTCLPGFTEGDHTLFDYPDAELADLVVNGNRVGSIKSNLLAMLACGEQVRERLSADTRIILNKLRDNLNELDRAYVGGLPEAPEESLDNLVTSLLALSGLSNESMLRGQDWLFLQMGHSTECAIQTAKLLQSTLAPRLGGVAQQQVLESVLLSVEALISYRRRYRTKAKVPFGLDLLMVDSTNPRSLVFQVQRLREYLEFLPKNSSYVPGGLSNEVRLVLKTLNDIQLTDLEALSTANPETNSRDAFSTLMAQVGEQLEQFTSIIADKYFDHTAGPQQLIKPKWKMDV
ncbi:circularly permuted type 2 ATP-grasp protein [Enterovibrio calviensis]|uniref:circularly permuted type 2 ATP-grasp protein n=1 Tax=Enterovibrio calviensis TaxID=91359 RepID=UPI000A5535FD|nr:circularly permuted type 2 ATP-grasp protein [Enterovibrio calviensis]